MKNLIISIICLLVLMIPWGAYHKYSDVCTVRYQSIIADKIIPAASSNNWEQVNESFDIIAKDWDHFRRISGYFIDTNSLDTVTAHIIKVSAYIKQQDTDNVVAESAVLQYELNSLCENETPSVSNLF